MVKRFMLAAVVVFACLTLGVPDTIADETTPSPAELFANGKSLLTKGDIDGAQRAFLAAARAERTNQVYKQYALVLRRVVALRKAVAEGTPSPDWEKMVVTLHSFYLRHRVLTAGLALDRMAHGKLRSADSEARFAEMLLECGAEIEAAEMLARPATWQRDVRHAIARGIALARLSRIDEAVAIAKQTPVPADASPHVLRDRARLESRIAHHTDALGLLKRCFEKTPAANLPELKAWVRGCSDFKSLLTSADFEKVMKTTSKVAPSSCSGGKDCGSCPKRGGCGKKG